jgi:hypothetical protein
MADAPTPLGAGRTATARAAELLREAERTDLSQRPEHYERAADALEEALAGRGGDEHGPPAP